MRPPVLLLLALLAPLTAGADTFLGSTFDWQAAYAEAERRGIEPLL